MATINRSAINKLLWMGINTVFGMNYKDRPEEWMSVFEKRTSRQAWEEDQLMTGTGYASVEITQVSDAWIVVEATTRSGREQHTYRINPRDIEVHQAKAAA